MENRLTLLEDAHPSVENEISGLQDVIAGLQDEIAGLKDKVQALDEQKAPKFVAVSPLALNSDLYPNELSIEPEPEPEINASAVRFNGVDSYIQFEQGRGDILDVAKDWTVGVTVVVQDSAVEGTNLATFGSGGCSLTLKVQGAPSESSSWGSYKTSAGVCIM